MRLDQLNDLEEEAATRELLRCCGSTKWARAMAAARPFASLDAMVSAADAVSASLERSDWLEAFAAHPKIGAVGSGASTGGRASGEGREAEWSSGEQAGVASASADVLARLTEANREYEARFGYIFIVCATGKSADEMLQLLARRLDNYPDTEWRVAADEQRKITRLRLAKLIESANMITTHVLDTSQGGPAVGVGVVLDVLQGNGWIEVGRGVTDANGRLTNLTEGRAVAEGTYRLKFDSGAYHRSRGISQSFFPEVHITFVVSEAGGHYHVPLLLSPFGYSTYRGT
jgi:hydroxyisourate hydrolase